MKIQTKLIALLVVPLIGLTVIGVQAFHENRQAAQNMNVVEDMAELSVYIGEVVHEAQRERGRTGGYLGSDGENFRTELTAQHRETDTSIRELQSYLDDFDQARLDSVVQSVLSEAVANLNRLQSVRDEVESLRIASADALGYYTETIDQFLNLITEMGKHSDSAEVTVIINSYANFLRAKENAGIERAVLTTTFANDEFPDGMYEQFIALMTRQESYLNDFTALASDDIIDAYRTASSDASFGQVDSYRETAMENAASGGFGVDPMTWFDTSTTRINRFKEVEDSAAEELQATAATIRAEATRTQWISGMLTGSICLITVVGGFLCLRSIILPLKAVVSRLQDIAEGEGDLTQRVDEDRKDELGEVGKWFNAFVSRIESVVSEVIAGSVQMDSGASQVASASQSLAEGSSEQASSLEEISASIEEMSSMTQQNSENVRQASGLSDEARDAVNRGQEEMNRMSESMSEIRRSSGEMANIIKVIDEIAFQTNLLALNAAVEAARAGEAGKGFAVVAEEVRNLAQRSAEAAKSTSQMIEDSGKKCEEGVQITDRVAEVLGQIVESSTKVNTLLSEVASASNEQTSGIEQINTGVTQLDKVTQQNAGNAEELASSAEEMSSQVTSLRDLVGQFKVSSAAGTQTPQHSERRASDAAERPEAPAPAPRQTETSAPRETAALAPTNGHAPAKPTSPSKQRIPMDDSEVLASF